MRRLATTACAALLSCGLLAGPAFADGASFSETQSADDQLFHIDVTVDFGQAGGPPREANSGAGTVRVSLPGAQARFDPAGSADPAGYTCSAGSGVYGAAATGFVCATDGQVAGAGLAFPRSVTLHLVSPDCYAPPAQGSGQPAVAEVWAAPGVPDAPADTTFQLVGDPGCQLGEEEPPVDPDTPVVCIVPKLQKVALTKATTKLRNAGCARGKVRYAYSARIKKGRVISQAVTPGRHLKAGYKVRLVVSLGRNKRTG